MATDAVPPMYRSLPLPPQCETRGAAPAKKSGTASPSYLTRAGTLGEKRATVGSSDVKFEYRGQALGPKSGPVGLLPGLNASCWAHAGLSRGSLMLKGYTAELDGLIPGPEMNGLMLDSSSLVCWWWWRRPLFWGKFATSSKEDCFSHHLAISIQLVYIDCIFPPIHRLYFPFPVKHRIFGSFSFCDIPIYVGTYLCISSGGNLCERKHMLLT